MLLSLTWAQADFGLLRGSDSSIGGNGSNEEAQRSTPTSPETEGSGLRGSGSEPTAKSSSSSMTAPKVKYREPGQQTRREKRCPEEKLEVCGHGQGNLVCEYSDQRNLYATRCVRQNKMSLHLQLHPNNYCGTCQRCFDDSEELRLAVKQYIDNSTQYTAVAKNYGWPINKWCVGKITDFSRLFANERKFKDELGDWDVSQAINMSGMFQSAFSFNADLSLWKTDRVVDMTSMFDGAHAYDQSLATWNTERVTSMKKMFRVAKAFDQDLSSWKTGNVRDMSYMMYRAHGFQSPMPSNVSSLQDMSYLFAFTRRFNDSSIVEWDVSRVQSMRAAFQNTVSFSQDLSAWNVAKVQDTSFMFYRAMGLQQDDVKERAIVKKWDLSNIRLKQNMFTFAEAALNATTVPQDGVAHPSYDGSSMAQTENA